VASGDDVAQAVARAFVDRFVFPIRLGGKHSKGSMLARDEQTHTTWLLKPGSGNQSPAAGAQQDPSTMSAREAAWYQVAKAWDLDRWFPRAELLVINGREYAAMKLLPWSFKTMEKHKVRDPGFPRRVLQRFLNDGTIHRWAVLYYVLGEPDGHGQNVMMDEDGEVRFIDHGSAFAGSQFDPANDQDSFVPAFLRAWAPPQFNALPPEEKLRSMPRVNARVAGELQAWILGLQPSELAALLVPYGIDPKPSLERLARLRAAVTGAPADEAINRLWTST
jgi:hypothetical protein